MIEEELKKLPPRPYIPPLAVAAFLACFQAATVHELYWRVYIGAIGEPLALLLSFVSCSLFLLIGYLVLRSVFRGKNVNVFICAFCLVAVLVSSLLTQRSQNSSFDTCNRAASSYEYEIVSDPRPTSRGYLYDAVCRMSGADVVGKVSLSSQDSYSRGARIGIVGRTARLENDEWGRSLFDRGVTREVSVVQTKRVSTTALNPILRLRSHVLASIAPDRSPGASVIAALLCGYTTSLKENGLQEKISTVGCSHLFAVSGSHLSVVAALIGIVMTRLNLGIRSVRLLTLCLCMGFVAFSGASSSAVRSVVMVAFGMVVAASDRRRHPLSLLALAVLLLVIWNPLSIYDLGFQLSVLSVLAIHLFSSYVSCLFMRMRVPRGISDMLACTLSAQMATLPITLPLFGSLSLLAPLSSAVLGTLVSGLLSLSLCLAPFATVARWVLSPALWLANTVVFLIDLLSSIPFASISIETQGLLTYVPYALLAAIYLGWPDLKARAVGIGVTLPLLALFAAIGYWRFWAPASVTVMDVGQADSILIREGSHAVLVDAGVDDRAAAALLRNGVIHLDAVVVTHWDKDHYGGLNDIARQCLVDRVIIARGAEESVPAEIDSSLAGKVCELDYGDSLSIGNFRARMVWPEAPVEGEENGDSLCLLVTYPTASDSFEMLLTGDSELDQERVYADEVGDIDVLKVGHHGSKVSVDTELLGRLRPEVCVASAGAGNSYGHPSRECREAVASVDARFYCTIDSGDVTFTPSERGVKVTTSKTADAA